MLELGGPLGRQALAQRILDGGEILGAGPNGGQGGGMGLDDQPDLHDVGGARLLEPAEELRPRAGLRPLT
jgi:hypothetical protein